VPATCAAFRARRPRWPPSWSTNRAGRQKVLEIGNSDPQDRCVLSGRRHGRRAGACRGTATGMGHPIRSSDSRGSASLRAETKNERPSRCLSGGIAEEDPVAVVMDDPQTPTICAKIPMALRLAAIRASCASLRHHHDHALSGGACARQDRVAVKTSCQPPPITPIQYLLGNQTREKLEAFRGYKGAQSYPSRTKGRGRRGFLPPASVGLGVRPDTVLIARAGLREGQGLGPRIGPRGGWIALVGRCRDGRRQYLRGPARRLEARGAQQPGGSSTTTARAWMRSSARVFGARFEELFPGFRLGCRDPEIWLAAGSPRFARTRRRQTAGLDRRLSQSALLPRWPIKAEPPGASA